MSDPDKADDMDRILDRFGHVQEEYEHLGGYALESQAREVLHGLGFKDDQIDGDVGALSGGWKMRVALARVLLGMPDVLLMDEPTNHLEHRIHHLARKQFLGSFPGALLMTSTTCCEFMNRLVSKIAEIDGGEIITYSGDYDFYERERAVRESNQQAAFARQQSMLAKEQRFIDRFQDARRESGFRCRAGSRRWTRSRKSNCLQKTAGREIRLSRSTPLRRDRLADLSKSAQELRPARDLRRVQSHHPPRRTLGRHGEKRRGQVYAS